MKGRIPIPAAEVALFCFLCLVLAVLLNALLCSTVGAHGPGLRGGVNGYTSWSPDRLVGVTIQGCVYGSGAVLPPIGTNHYGGTICP